MRLRRSVIALMAVLGLALVSACNNGDDSGKAADNGLQKVSYLTSFNTFGREAYAYVALDKGYFKDAGFDVKITPGSGTVDVMKLVAGGQADYGIGDFTATVITLAKQKLPVTTVGMVHQRSMAAIMSLEGLGINSPKDLPGKTIGDQPGSTNTVMFPVYAKAVVLPYGKALPDLYGNAIITRTDMAKDHPDQVKKFTGALLKGLQDTYDDPAAAAATLKKYVPNTDLAVATKELEIMKEYIKPDDFKGPLGDVTQERVQKVISLLEESDAIGKGAVKPEDVVTLSLAPKS